MTKKTMDDHHNHPTHHRRHYSHQKVNKRNGNELTSFPSSPNNSNNNRNNKPQQSRKSTKSCLTTKSLSIQSSDSAFFRELEKNHSLLERLFENVSDPSDWSNCKAIRLSSPSHHKIKIEILDDNGGTRRQHEFEPKAKKQDHAEVFDKKNNVNKIDLIKINDEDDEQQNNRKVVIWLTTSPNVRQNHHHNNNNHGKIEKSRKKKSARPPKPPKSS